jgi:hypothetical protein
MNHNVRRLFDISLTKIGKYSVTTLQTREIKTVNPQPLREATEVSARGGRFRTSGSLLYTHINSALCY